MEEQRSKNKSLIIVLAVCILLIIAIVSYVLFFNKNEGNVNKNENNTGVTSSPALYHIVDGEEATIYDFDDKQIKISLDYPQIDIDLEEIKKINQKIKDDYERAYKLDFSYEIAPDADILPEVEKNGKYYSNEYGEFNYITYNISDTDEYLAMSFNNKTYCHCSGGGFIYGYVIDKKTKKVLTNSEIVKLFNKSEKNIIEEYNDDIAKMTCFDESDKAKNINDITLYVDSNELFYVKESCN